MSENQKYIKQHLQEKVIINKVNIRNEARSLARQYQSVNLNKK